MTADLVGYKRGRERWSAHRPLTHSLDYSKEGLGMNPTQEQWRPVVGYEGLYEVSDHGRVRSLDRMVRHPRYGHFTRKGTQLKASPNNDGHMGVTLHFEGKANSRRVHRLVLEAFVGPAPEGTQACHWDDVKSNNHLSNLRWGSIADNSRDAVRNGGHNQASKTHCRNGHEYSTENTYLTPNGWRRCQTCCRAAERRYRASKGVRHA